VSYSDVAVTDLLGVKPKNQENPLALAQRVERGLPVSTLEKFAGHVSPHDVRRFSYRLVPKSTLERRRRDKKPLTTEESDRLARIAKVFAFGLEIFHDEAKVRTFLDRPHPMLDNKPPLEVALATGPGADAVINILGRAAYSGGVRVSRRPIAFSPATASATLTAPFRSTTPKAPGFIPAAGTRGPRRSSVRPSTIPRRCWKKWCMPIS
jgi:putative toxin-antitoxin system antitoxin component (TIGR02293 family)